MKVIWSGDAWDDYLHWQKSDPDVVDRINALIANARRTPLEGIGKPEPLRGRLAGWWSRRITVTHRLVYRVGGKGADQGLEIASCRLHYQS
ncbi:Txe/YoeB family addiction module toxin [Methylobacterium haplocladii]|uniref:Putative mRNA interferase YoeB n=1 Tax=Methylobacterium haplocladii TaxID=1176176 RepID=A0A512ILG6_9HYPH|nr:Txe/YoeB family addiction module toxin [Methylobacterium haplocladii]GEO98478.1 addiction module protein [Methylobacterium haplocladii]GJD82785.1 Toxin YoeB [Methylobacterium haplocladii]GLS61128.1 addiction module protein [Methylobacterium haplocladii]